MIIKRKIFSRYSSDDVSIETDYNTIPDRILSSADGIIYYVDTSPLSNIDGVKRTNYRAKCVISPLRYLFKKKSDNKKD